MFINTHTYIYIHKYICTSVWMHGCLVYNSIYWNVTICTGMYWHVMVCNVVQYDVMQCICRCIRICICICKCLCIYTYTYICIYIYNIISMLLARQKGSVEASSIAVVALYTWSFLLW